MNYDPVAMKRIPSNFSVHVLHCVALLGASDCVDAIQLVDRAGCDWRAARS